MSSKHKQSNPAIIVALILLALTIIAAFFYQQNKTAKDAPTVAEESVPAEPKKAESLEAEQTLSIEKAVEDKLQETSSAETEDVDTPAPGPQPPLVETIRVEADGAVVLAGRSDPDTTIKILLDEVLVETVQSDGSGNFVALFDIGVSTNVRVLSLLVDVGGKEVYAEEEIIIAASQSAESVTSDETVIAQAEPSIADDAETPIEQDQISEPNIETEEETLGDKVLETATNETLTETQSEEVKTDDDLLTENASEANVSVEVDSVAEAQTDPVGQVDVATETNQSVSTAEPETDTATSTQSVEIAKTDVSEDAVSAEQTSSEEKLPQKTNEEEQVAKIEPIIEEPEETVTDENSTVVTEPATVATQETETETAVIETVPAQSETVAKAEVSEDGAEIQTLPAEETEKEENTEEPLVVIAGKDGVKVVQSSKQNSSQDVSVDAISYDETGEVSLTGRGKPSQIVRIYLNNMPISTAAMDATGQWSTALSEIDAGIYTLRVDELDKTGNVVSRLETPFKRERRQDLAAYMTSVDEPARINVVTVQPGNTLWAIARKRYGRGILYVRVFEENKEKIRNPDLIYPGQVFSLPDD
ncbi:MAG: LysM peptidoglycan-binding domain-containing protein [Proteobacteria bacterium]|nr:LysM peptidoglycan-binding domain-containing protein [Pseudomonadota bacterium]MDA0851713.1 LysM peptidoglycan-binding domain-containing protein [Pseudomonadota bacterium]MDA1294575.1 LysM peptidoglycan-binding domain-containing protein [Pseudomonadota bacterium]